MKKWINNRSNQISVLLVGAISVLLFNFIMPAYEKLPYFNQKIDALLHNQRQLEKSVIHISAHEKQIDSIKKEIHKFQKQIDESKDSRLLQNRLGQLQRKHHLKVLTQKIDSKPFGDDLNKIIVKLTLKGGYRNIKSYFKEINTSNSSFIITNVTISSLHPLKKDADLLIDLEIQIFYPKK